MQGTEQGLTRIRVLDQFRIGMAKTAKALNDFPLIVGSLAHFAHAFTGKLSGSGHQDVADFAKTCFRGLL
jgi:hypothetical protein